MKERGNESTREAAEEKLNKLHEQANTVIGTAAALIDKYGRESDEYSHFLADMTKALTSDLTTDPIGAGTSILILFASAVDIGAQTLVDLVSEEQKSQGDA